MSGFAAIVDLAPHDAGHAKISLSGMLNVMRRRGGSGDFRGATTTAVMGALTHHPAMRPQQLVFHEDHLACAGDFRLDQRAALIRTLEEEESLGDAELALKAYRRFGDEMVHHLLGDFGFIVSDGHSVFCARDHFGIKPLYYHFSGRRLVVGSEAAAVQSVVGAQLNQQRIADSLVFPMEHADKTSSFYQGIHRLPPASTLTLQNGQLRIRQYWAPDVERRIRFGTEREYTEAFRELFQNAVTDRIDSDATGVASMLSGGVDSSTIVGFAHQVKPVTTFSTVEFEGECAETDYIQRTQQHLRHSAVLITRDDAAGVLDSVFDAIGAVSEPFDHYMIQNMLVNHAASQHGFHSLFDGLEGDMLHSLSTHYPSGLMRQGDIFGGLKEVYAVWKHAFGREIPLWVAYYQSIRQIGLPDSFQWLRSIKAAASPQKNPLKASLISNSFAAETQVVDRLHALSKRLYGRNRSIHEQHLANVMHPAIPAATERYDRVAGLFGMEARHPLMDKRLIEFSLGIPREQKTSKGWSKYHLRSIGAGVIPAEVSWRIGRDENAWRFIELVTTTYKAEMRAQVLGSRDLLAPYIAPEHLDRTSDDNLIELYGLLSWLKRNL